MRKWIFHFFTKIQKQIIDPNDPQWRWILWIMSKARYFGYNNDPKRFFTTEPNIVNIASSNSKQS